MSQTSSGERPHEQAARRELIVVPEHWFVVLDSEFHGPISRATLAEVLAEHAHDEDTPIWSAEQFEEWTTMHAVPGLAEEVAVCRAARERRPRVTHPSELAAFAAVVDGTPAARPSTSGRVDIAGALRALAAKNAPVAGRPLPRAPAVPPPLPKRAAPPPTRRRTWAHVGLAFGAVAMGTFVAWATTAHEQPRVEMPPAEAIVAAAREVAPSVSAADARSSDPADERSIVEPIVTRSTSTRDEAPEELAAAREARHVRAEAVVIASAPPVLDDEPPAVEATSTAALDGETDTEIEDEPETDVSSDDGAEVDEEVVTSDEAPPSIEDLILAAVPVEPVPAQAPSVEEPETRDAPSDAEIVQAIDAQRDALLACTPVRATAELRLTLDGASGRVTAVLVDGVFSGTPAGSCIARTLRRVRVAPFAQATFTASQSYRL